jgi:hypothetical protein
MSGVTLKRRPGILILLAFMIGARPAQGQVVEALGARALGMGGAFVAVANDATASYWNPAGLATLLFSFVVDRGEDELVPDDPAAAGESHSSFFIGMGLPQLGISYYRLRASHVSALPDAPADRTLFSLVTHHTGATVLQSVSDRLVIGTTLKAVSGSPAIAQTPDSGSVEELLDAADELSAQGDTEFDLDIGVMANFGRARAGFLARNVREPEFSTPSGPPVSLDRQMRGGLAVLPGPRTTLSVDFDFTTTTTATGEWRSVAVGGEHGLGGGRVVLRAGFRAQTIGETRPLGAFGASVAIGRNLLIDGQYTGGNEEVGRGWNVAGRVAY